MNKFVMISVTEAKLFMRNFFSVMFAFMFPVAMLLLFGGMYGNKPSSYLGGYGAVDLSAADYSCMVIAVTGLMSLPLTVAQYREKKILKRFMATPVRPLDVLFSQVVVNLVMTIAGIAILLVTGKIVFDMHFNGHILAIVFAFLLITFSIFSLGLLIAGVSPNGKAANAISFIVYFPMIFLSGSTMPVEMMPKAVRTIAKVLPLTYGVDLFKGLWLGGKISQYTTDIIVLFSVFIVCTLIAVKSFKWE